MSAMRCLPARLRHQPDQALAGRYAHMAHGGLVESATGQQRHIAVLVGKILAMAISRSAASTSGRASPSGVLPEGAMRSRTAAARASSIRSAARPTRSRSLARWIRAGSPVARNPSTHARRYRSNSPCTDMQRPGQPRCEGARTPSPATPRPGTDRAGTAANRQNNALFSRLDRRINALM